METNLDQLFKTDSTLEQDGVDFVIVPEDKSKIPPVEEVSFRLRRFNSRNPRVKAAMASYYKPYSRQVEMGTLPVEKSEEITQKLFIDVCLVSWTGVKEKGVDLECNKANALALFKRLPDMFEALWTYANNFENFKEDLGNS